MLLPILPPVIYQYFYLSGTYLFQGFAPIKFYKDSTSNTILDQNWSFFCYFYLVIRVQVLVLSPTRELASQTEKVIRTIGDFMNVQAHSCVGGKSLGEDIRKLEHGVHVVSGTPGRVCDMIKRRALRTRAIKLLVLVSFLPSSMFAKSVCIR